MAISAATLTADFSGFLSPERSAPIFEKAAEASVMMRLAQQVPLGIAGTEIPVVTGELSAGWVSEGGQKPASAGALSLKTITPKKLATIAVVSAEVVRANPGGYMDLLRPQVAKAFARAFDRAAFHDEGPTGTAGGGPFATYIDQTTKSVELGGNTQVNGGIHKDLVDALAELTDAEKELTGWALDNRTEVRLWGAVDSTGRPLYVDLPSDSIAQGLARPGRLLARPSFMGKYVADSGVDIVGYAGDWTQAAWGVIGGISYRISTEAAVTINGTLTSLFEHNMLALLAEAEYGFLVNDTDAFVQLRNDTGS